MWKTFLTKQRNISLLRNTLRSHILLLLCAERLYRFNKRATQWHDDYVYMRYEIVFVLANVVIVPLIVFVVCGCVRPLMKCHLIFESQGWHYWRWFVVTRFVCKQQRKNHIAQQQFLHFTLFNTSMRFPATNSYKRTELFRRKFRRTFSNSFHNRTIFISPIKWTYNQVFGFFIKHIQSFHLNDANVW